MKEPQSETALWHVTVQSTPELVRSFWTSAATGACWPVSSEVGSTGWVQFGTLGPQKVMLILEGGLMVTTAVTVVAGAATEAATIVTLPEAGTEAGAV